MIQKIVTILFLSGEPILVSKLALFLEATEEDVKKKLAEVAVSLQSLGLVLLQAEDGVSIATSQEQASLVEKFWKEELKGDLTPATLQVLTLVAYLGKGTREQISYIRGVQSAQSIRTLTVRGLVQRSGEVCVLTSEALKHLGITRVEDLPDYQVMHTQLLEKLETKDA